MTDRTLLRGDTEPARLPGYGIIPGTWARKLITQGQRQGQGQGEQGRVQPAARDAAAVDPTSLEELKIRVRRLYTAPGTGNLVAMDSKRRRAKPATTPKNSPAGKPNPD